MPNPTLNQVYANSAQVVDVPKALELAEELASLAFMFNTEEDKNIRDLWRKRAFAFLNRACELECVPVHKRVVETSNGLREAWCTFAHVSIDFDYECDIEGVFLGYCDSMTESQARMRALS